MLKSVRNALGSGAALILLSACSGGASSSSSSAVPQLSQSRQIPQAAQAASSFGVLAPTAGQIGLRPSFHGFQTFTKERSPGWMSEDAKSPSAKIYVSDYGANAVYIYNAKKPTTPIGTITNGINAPLGNFTDSKGTLYVTNYNSNTVTVYALGKTAPNKTYSNGLSGPISVAVGKDGTLYVAEYAAGTVVEYDKGTTSPSRTISIGSPEGVALDSKNNLYVSNNSTGQGTVEEFAPKATTGKDLGIIVSFAGDLKLDKKNDILLEDQNAQTVDFFKHGATQPYGSITVSGDDTYKLALNAQETLLYVATASTTVPFFQAKPSGSLAGTISGFGASTGVSLTPAPPLDE